MFFVNLGMYVSNTFTFIYRIEKYQNDTNDQDNNSIECISKYQGTSQYLSTRLKSLLFLLAAKKTFYLSQHNNFTKDFRFFN